jgi:hypothetical protein
MILYKNYKNLVVKLRKNYYIFSFHSFLQIRRYYKVKIIEIVDSDFMLFKTDKNINKDDLLRFKVRIFDIDRLLKEVLKDE